MSLQEDRARAKSIASDIRALTRCGDKSSPEAPSQEDVLRALLLCLYELEADAYDRRLFMVAELIGMAAIATGEELTKRDFLDRIVRAEVGPGLTDDL